ncbi:MAG: hypothetical protein ACYS1C_04150 [Planctomycetota bacterium]|jgi:hypothetical protein
MADSGHRGLLNGILRRVLAGRNGSNGAPYLLEPEAFGAAIRRERSRADRTREPFSLVVVATSLNGMRDAAGLRARLTEELAEIVAQRVRCTDVAGWLDRDSLGLILSATFGEDAWNVVEDVQISLARTFGAPLAARMVSYRVHSYPFDVGAPRARCRQTSLFEPGREPSIR